MGKCSPYLFSNDINDLLSFYQCATSVSWPGKAILILANSVVITVFWAPGCSQGRARLKYELFRSVSFARKFQEMPFYTVIKLKVLHTTILLPGYQEGRRVVILSLGINFLVFQSSYSSNLALRLVTDSSPGLRLTTLLGKSERGRK